MDKRFSFRKLIRPPRLGNTRICISLLNAPRVFNRRCCRCSIVMTNRLPIRRVVQSVRSRCNSFEEPHVSTDCRNSSRSNARDAGCLTRSPDTDNGSHHNAARICNRGCRRLAWARSLVLTERSRFDAPSWRTSRSLRAISALKGEADTGAFLVCGQERPRHYGVEASVRACTADHFGDNRPWCETRRDFSTDR